MLTILDLLLLLLLLLFLILLLLFVRQMNRPVASMKATQGDCTPQSLQIAIEFPVSLHRIGPDSLPLVAQKPAFLQYVISCLHCRSAGASFGKSNFKLSVQVVPKTIMTCP